MLWMLPVHLLMDSASTSLLDARNNILISAFAITTPPLRASEWLLWWRICLRLDFSDAQPTQKDLSTLLFCHDFPWVLHNQAAPVLLWGCRLWLSSALWNGFPTLRLGWPPADCRDYQLLIVSPSAQGCLQARAMVQSVIFPRGQVCSKGLLCGSCPSGSHRSNWNLETVNEAPSESHCNPKLRGNWLVIFSKSQGAAGGFHRYLPVGLLSYDLARCKSHG